jgi:hypothetical protein
VGCSLLVAWLVVGGSWVLLTIAMWASNPPDDVDRAPMARLALTSIIVWVVLGGVLGVVAGALAGRRDDPASADPE